MYDTHSELNSFEKCHVIGQRAQQIAAGAPSTIPILSTDCALSIAEREYALQKIPLVVSRKLPNGIEVIKKIYSSEN